MRKVYFLYLLLPVMMIASLTSCGGKKADEPQKNASEQFEDAAKEQMEKTFKEIAKNPDTVELTNIETKYLDDSLCIIHVDFTAENDLGTEITNKTEYIYLRSNGKCYEAFHDIDSEEDNVFIEKEVFEKEKVGKIYEKLVYRAGLRYFAAKYINSNGREAGVEDCPEFTIPLPTGTGLWELRTFKDEFGDESTDKYLLLEGKGTFNNSATTGSRMTAYLFVDKEHFSFRLIEYSSNIVKDKGTYTYRIKDSTGTIHEMSLFNSSSGQMISLRPSDNALIDEILSKGGTISVSVKEDDGYMPSSYLFKMNVSGYDRAVTFL